MNGSRAFGVGGWLLLAVVGCGRAERSEPFPSTGGGSGGTSSADDARVAANGLMLPVRDPRESCTGLGIRFSSTLPPQQCPPLTCDCIGFDLSQFAFNQGCFTAIDCEAFCGLGPTAFAWLSKCASAAPCGADRGCKPDERCDLAEQGDQGFCSSECLADQDCVFPACVVVGDTGATTCGNGAPWAPCNRPEHCSSGVCLFHPADFEGACTDGKIGSPCSTSQDCNAALACIPDVDSAPRPPGFGSCSDGSVKSPCQTNADCVSGLCVQSQHQCMSGTRGSYCDANTECVDGQCSSDGDTPAYCH